MYDPCGFTPPLIAYLLIHCARDEHLEKMRIIEVSLLLVCAVCAAAGDVKPLEIAALLPSAHFSSAARLAADTINRDRSILPDRHIKLIEVITGECHSGSLRDDRYGPLVGAVSAVTRKGRAVVGVVGPFCTGLSPIRLLSSVIEKYMYNVVHISGSPCSCLQENRFSSFYSVVPFDDVYISAVVNVIESFEWRRIGVISCHDDVCMKRSRYLTQLTMLSDSSVQIVSSLTIFSEFSIRHALHSIRESDVTIVVLTMYISQVCNTLCHAYQDKLTWPKYAWIVHGHRFGEALREADSSSYCDMREALEGVLFLNIDFQPEDSMDVIVSGQTYEDYTRGYQSNSNFTLPDRSRANLLYDSVWALALALNSTEEPNNASLVKDRLSSVAFAGASGSISLNSTSQNLRKVDIFHIQGGYPKIIGHYSEHTVVLNHTPLVSIPSDSLPRVYTSLPLWASIVLGVVLFGLVILTAVLLLLYLCFRKEPEIKATSPYLSLLAFAGVFSIFIGTQLQVISASSSNVSTPLCLSIVWLIEHGDVIILATVIVKMIRVYHIFNYFGKTGRVWSDTILFLEIICMTLVATVIDTLWIIIGLHGVEKTERVVDGEVFVTVSCRLYEYHFLLFISSCYGAALRIVLVVVAIMSRKIRRKHFKDTKKANIFIALNIPFAFMLLISYNLISDRTLRIVLDFVSLNSFSILYVAFFLIPKIIPPFWRRLKKCKPSTVCHFKFI